MNAIPKWRAYYAPQGRIRMLGGNPALDLANTLHWRDGELVDFVSDYRSLVEWSVPAMLLSEEEKVILLSRSAPENAECAAIHNQWQDLRASLKQWLITAQSQNPEHQQSGIKLHKSLSAKIAAAAKFATLAELLSENTNRPESLPLALPLLRSATSVWQLLRFPPQGTIRQCEADSCGGFFLDQSRAKPRRWCSMDSCGNREKAARHRQSAQ